MQTRPVPLTQASLFRNRESNILFDVSLPGNIKTMDGARSGLFVPQHARYTVQTPEELSDASRHGFQWNPDPSADASQPMHHFGWRCRTQCGPCTAIAKRTGLRCRMRVCIGLPFCTLHTRSRLHLDIHKSSIVGGGNGLFAIAHTPPQRAATEPVFRMGEVIVRVDGEFVDTADASKVYGEDNTVPYGFEMRKPARGGRTKGLLLDGACVRGIAQLINSISGSDRQQNVEMQMMLGYGNKPMVLVYAAADIFHGEELLWDYGQDYTFAETVQETQTPKYTVY